MDKDQKKKEKKKPRTRREAFDAYLRKKGILTTLTKVLVDMYEEEPKPSCAMEYVRERLAMNANVETYSEMSSQLQELLNRIQQLHFQVVKLRLTLEELEAAIEQREAEANPEEQETQ